MPELPEVETVKRGLAPVMEGSCFQRVILNRSDLRFAFPPDFVKRLEGTEVERLNRRAKFLMATLSSGETLLMHLGMSGSFIVGEARAQQNPKHDHVVFEMSGGSRIIYNDPRRFGFMELLVKGDVGRLAHIGPEPLSNLFNSPCLLKALHDKKASIKSALLDQRVVAGLGNIYVCEALYDAHISPKRPARTLTISEGERLCGTIKLTLERAIKAGGSSLKDFVNAEGNLGYFQHSFLVYDREDEDCMAEGCNGVIQRMKQSGRSTFFCPKCQK